MNDVETLEANLRFAEEKNRKLKQGLWDEFFKAALTGVAASDRTAPVNVLVTTAAKFADESTKLRDAQIPSSVVRDLKGVLGVSISLLEDAVAVIETIEADDEEERARLALLVEKMDRFIKGARGKA